MLSYALAIAVAISSSILFSTAFVMSHIHRRDDFLWSGVGLFYALVLWYCAKNITGAVLLGQTAATALLVSYSWQTIKLRRALANPAKAEEIGNFSILRSLNGLLQRRQALVKPKAKPSTPTSPQPKVTESEIAIPDTASPEKPNVSKPSVTEPPTITPDVATKAANPVAQPSATPTAVPTTTPKSAEMTPKPDVVKDVAEIAPEITTDPSKESEIAATPDQQDNKAEAPQSEIVPSAIKPVKIQQPEPKKIEGDRAEDKLDNSLENIQSQSQPEAELEIDPEVLPQVPPTPPAVKSGSALDNLETVEVAEVLEAIPEDEGDRDNDDLANIIEVTTTEIKVTTEVKQVPPEDAES